MIGELGDSSRNFFHLAALIQLGLPRGAACHPQKHHSSNHHRENLSNPHAATVPLPCRLARFLGALRPLSQPYVGVSLLLNDTAEPCPSVTPTNRVRFSPADKPDASLSGKWGPVFLGWHWLHCWGRTVFLHGKPKRLAKWQSARCSPAAPTTSAKPSTAFS